ncbi:hypothetical protein VPH35_002530 [Triticum aestivum]
MERLGDGEGKNGSRCSAMSTTRGEDKFAGAIVAAVEDAHHDSVAPVHYIGRGDYVVVNGFIRTWDSVMHIRVYSIRLVTNYNNISHHFLNCVYVSLHVQKQLREREMNIERTNLVVASNEQSRVPNGAERLFADVLRVFYRLGIVKRGSFSLIQSQTGAYADELRSVIGAHVSMGNLFITIDDDHFKCLFNV